MEAESKARSLELEAREVVERAARAMAERDAARHEVAMARLEIKVAGGTRAQMESKLARVQRALASSKDAQQKVESDLDGARQALATFGEAWRKTEDETSRLTDERVSLLVELGASKDELSAFRAEVSKEKKALEAEYNAGFKVIFNYGYGCCAFAHNIYGSKPGIPAGMSDITNPLTPEFFVNPRCPLGAVIGEATTTPKADISEEVERSFATRTKVGDNHDSLSRVAREMEELGPSSKS